MTMQSITQSQGDGRQQPAYDSRVLACKEKKGLICTVPPPTDSVCMYITTGSSPIASSHPTTTTIPPNHKTHRKKKKRQGLHSPTSKHEHIRTTHTTTTSPNGPSLQKKKRSGTSETCIPTTLAHPWRRDRPPNKKASDGGGGPALLSVRSGSRCSRRPSPLSRDQGVPKIEAGLLSRKEYMHIFLAHAYVACSSPSCLGLPMNTSLLVVHWRDFLQELLHP